MHVISVLLAILGVGFLAWEIRSIRFVRDALRSGALTGPWRSRRKIAFLIGGALVLTMPWHVYPAGGGLAMGVPFFSAWYDAQGRDFIGAITVPALIGNAAVWFLAPQLVLGYLARKHLILDGDERSVAG